MYRKKLTYSFFTIPIAVASFNIYDWHRRRMLEKYHEISIRNTRVSEQPENIQNFYSNTEVTKKFPWIGLNQRQFNETYAYKPIELNGTYDHSNEVLVARNKSGEEGFDVITPFYCYKDENNKMQPILINRGWISYDYSQDFTHRNNASGFISIKGLLYKGDEGNKYTPENIIASEKWFKADPSEIATARLLTNRKDVSSQFLVKQIEYNPINMTSSPLVYNVRDLNKFPVSPELNGSFAYLWKGIVFLNLFSNLFVWIYL